MRIHRNKIFIASCALLSICILLYAFLGNPSNTEVKPIEDNKYDITKELKKANEKYDIKKKANILKEGKVNTKDISLVFENMADRKTMLSILDLLDKYHVKTTFFLTGNQCAEQDDIVHKIVKRGHNVQNLSLDGGVQKEDLSIDKCREDFVLSSKIIEVVSKNKPSFLRLQDSVYTDSVLANAKASGHNTIVAPSKFISYQSFKDAAQVEEYANALAPGNIVSIKTSGVLSSSEYQDKNSLAIDKKEGIKESTTTKKISIVKIVEWLLQSLDNKMEIVSLSKMASLQANYQPEEIPPISVKQHKDFTSFIVANNRRQEVPISMFYTTQKSVAYAFRGIKDENLTRQVLDTLDQMNAKATFFVSLQEIEEHRELLLEIIRRGHEIGNGGITTSTNLLSYSIQEICQEIYECHQAILSLGVSTNAYLPAHENTNALVNEAVSVIKLVPGMESYEVIAGTRTPILGKYQGKNAQQIVADYFKDISYLSLRTGDIVYINLDTNIINNSEKLSLLQEINNKLIKNGRVKKMMGNGSVQTQYIPLNYKITSVSRIQNVYETKTMNGRYSLVDGVGEVYANKLDSQSAYDSIVSKYIGNPDQNDWHFEDRELYKKLDQAGLIDTNGKPVIFFTFDDWAGDATTQKLLGVLDKHNVKGSFFTISRNVDMQGGLSNVNPNLLRAMALRGHDIGSHMYDHETLGASNEVVRNSVIDSYQVMHRAIGDLPSLKSYFRPPQLLITTYGLREVMAAGYTHSVSGTKSTGDYVAGSVSEVLKVLEDEIANADSKNRGTIFVMHFNDQSIYTAEAVDAFLTKNEQGAYGIKYEIAKLSDYLK